MGLSAHGLTKTAVTLQAATTIPVPRIRVSVSVVPVYHARMTTATILAALLALGAPRAFAPEVAQAIAVVARSDDEAAFLAAWARHESHYVRRIALNDCAPWECDHGRARGLWQAHANAAGSAWERLPGNVTLQASIAVRHYRYAFRDCGTTLGAFRRLGGLGCDRPLRGEGERLRSYARALRVISAAAPAAD